MKFCWIPGYEVVRLSFENAKRNTDKKIPEMFKKIVEKMEGKSR